MKLKLGGYTIVEVLLVLAVTGTMLLGAAVMLRGQQGNTQFQQTMRDIDSKLQATAKSVGNSLFPDSSSYKCAVQADGAGVRRPVLEAAPGGLGTNKDCIYIGRAVQVVKNSSTINVYNVLGVRKTASGGTVTTLAESNPTPAISEGADLTESYLPPANAARLKSATYVNLAGQTVNTAAEMAGFFYNLDGASSSGQQLLAKVYRLETDPGSPKTGVAACVQLDASCVNEGLKNWLLCYQSAFNNQTAQINIEILPAGVRTRLAFTSC